MATIAQQEIDYLPTEEQIKREKLQRYMEYVCALEEPCGPAIMLEETDNSWFNKHIVLAGEDPRMRELREHTRNLEKLARAGEIRSGFLGCFFGP